MTAVFYIAHTSPGRARIRWAGDTADKGNITELATRIESIPTVVSADPRITTGSIVIEHDAVDWPSLQAQLVDQLSMSFVAPPPAVKHSGAEALNRDIDRVDGALKHVNMDFHSVTLLMLSCLAIIQALRGQVMSSSVSFLWYAFTLATMARDRKNPIKDDIPEVSE